MTIINSLDYFKKLHKRVVAINKSHKKYRSSRRYYRALHDLGLSKLERLCLRNQEN